ncbi:MAG: phosphoribosylanthranilate isomerase [Hyphomicrobiales bacterium]
MASIAEMRMAVAYGADCVGLVGDMPSGPGVIAGTLARDIARAVPPGVSPVLLTSRTAAEDIADHVAFCGVNTVQIVNHIDPAVHERLADLIPAVRRLQVIHVENGEALRLIPFYEAHVHGFLLDSGRPKATVPELGGTGRTHDWAVSAEFVRRSALPVFLAGGLNPANVAAAIRRVGPYGVDLCSGLRSPLLLDETKLRAFMMEVKSASDWS